MHGKEFGADPVASLGRNRGGWGVHRSLDCLVPDRPRDRARRYRAGNGRRVPHVKNNRTLARPGPFTGRAVDCSEQCRATRQGKQRLLNRRGRFLLRKKLPGMGSFLHIATSGIPSPPRRAGGRAASRSAPPKPGRFKTQSSLRFETALRIPPVA